MPADAQSGENGKRLFVDAYSSLGKITVNSERSTLEANAVGIGGDFFLFHPLLNQRVSENGNAKKQTSNPYDCDNLF